MTEYVARLVKIIESQQLPTAETMKAELSMLFADHDLRIIDHHNTGSVMFIFSSDQGPLVLKIEHGAAKVTRDEAHWYNKVPNHFKRHFIAAGANPVQAFVLLKWLDDSRPLEEVAMTVASESLPAIDAYLDALAQDETLMASYETIPLITTRTSSFFRDKFFGKLKQAEPYAYLTNVLTSEAVRLNGRELPGPIACIERIHADASLREYLSPDCAGFIHGDLHADNLLVDTSGVYMIDPNGLDYLPIEYDHGRVLWSLTGWNAIVRRHEHTLVHDEDGYHLTVPIRAQYEAGRPRIEAYLRDYSLRHGLKPDQAYHRAVYSSAMQYLSRADHAAVEHEALALHLRGLEQLVNLLDELGINVNEGERR